jgi:hypothetical protein
MDANSIEEKCGHLHIIQKEMITKDLFKGKARKQQHHHSLPLIMEIPPLA